MTIYKLVRTGRSLRRGFGIGALLIVSILGYALHAAQASGIPDANALVYTGALTDATGAPITDERNVEISVFDAASGGAPLCLASSMSITPDASGRFQVVMPDTCATVVEDHPNLWVEVKVGGMSLGRSKIGAVPYAIEAKHAQEADSALTADNGIPPGAVAAFDLPQCPEGWSLYEIAVGRTIVGGGTIGKTVGSALADLEDRPHSHGVNPAPFSTNPADGAHAHSVNPPPTTSTLSDVSHSHTLSGSTDPGGAHNHRWIHLDYVNADNKYWETFDSNGVLQTPSAALIGWDNGIGNEGVDYYPIARHNPAADADYYTANAASHTHELSSGTVSRASLNHSHDVDIASFDISPGGAHNHSIDVPDTTSTVALTSSVMPYVQLLYCRKN